MLLRDFVCGIPAAFPGLERMGGTELTKHRSRVCIRFAHPCLANSNNVRQSLVEAAGIEPDLQVIKCCYITHYLCLLVDCIRFASDEIHGVPSAERPDFQVGCLQSVMVGDTGACKHVRH
jgi:hypothetical protein